MLLLNLGYGVLELGGGFLARSQGLQADALDFLGDGAITLLGVVALSLSALWRARAALLQGLFLGLMGLAVVGATVYRVFYQQMPEAGLMGLLSIGALVVNVICAMLLLKHRERDANVKAVWLFSRNDAIGNAAVLVAAGVVWLTASPWPDLIVAVGIAGLFLHSSWKIVQHARRELAEKDAD